MKREFPLGDVLSVLYKELVRFQGANGLYEIMEFMTRTEGLAAPGLKACRAHILDKYPELMDIELSGLETREEYDAWLLAQEAKHGKVLELEPLPRPS